MPGSLKVRMEFHKPWLKPGPFWGAVAGAVAALGIPEQAHEWLSLALVITLAEGVLSNWWDYLLNLVRWEPSACLEPREMVPHLPYTLPGSMAAGLQQFINRLINWWRQVFWPHQGENCMALATLTMVALVLGHLLMGQSLVILAAAGATGLLAALAVKRGRSPLPYEGLFAVTFPWLLGYVAFAPVKPGALLAAVFLGLMRWGMEGMQEGKIPRLALGSAYAGLVLLLWGIGRPETSAVIMLGALGTLFLGVLNSVYGKAPAEPDEGLPSRKEGTWASNVVKPEKAIEPLYLLGWASMMVCATALAMI